MAGLGARVVVARYCLLAAVVPGGAHSLQSAHCAIIVRHPSWAWVLCQCNKKNETLMC